MTTTMRLRAVILAMVVAFGLVASTPDEVAACVGRTMNFATAIRLSDGAIYAGRILGADDVDQFWKSLDIDIDVVVRGPAPPRVGRAQAGSVCDGIRVGEYGWIVRGVDDPYSSTEDLFFAISESAGRGALAAAGLPDTSTANVNSKPRIDQSAWLLVWAIATFGLAYLHLRARQRPPDWSRGR